MLKQHFDLLAEYNVWANHTQCTYLESAPDQDIIRHVVSSFPSIRDTLLHIWDAEAVWLMRLQGNSLLEFPSKRYEGTASEILKALPAQSGNLMEYTQSLTQELLAESVQYDTFRGDAFVNTRAEMLQHCFNHSTYHRGQIIMFTKQLGMQRPPSTDLIYYLRGRAADS